MDRLPTTVPSEPITSVGVASNESPGFVPWISNESVEFFGASAAVLDPLTVPDSDVVSSEELLSESSSLSFSPQPNANTSEDVNAKNFSLFKIGLLCFSFYSLLIQFVC